MAGPENAERRLEPPHYKVSCGGLDRVGSASTSATALNARSSEAKHQSPDKPVTCSARPAGTRPDDALGSCGAWGYSDPRASLLSQDAVR